MIFEAKNQQKSDLNNSAITMVIGYGHNNGHVFGKGPGQVMVMDIKMAILMVILTVIHRHGHAPGHYRSS